MVGQNKLPAYFGNHQNYEDPPQPEPDFGGEYVSPAQVKSSKASKEEEKKYIKEEVKEMRSRNVSRQGFVSQQENKSGLKKEDDIDIYKNDVYEKAQDFYANLEEEEFF